jgi:hypothetical protein
MPTIYNVTDALAAGGELPSLLAKLREFETKKAGLVEEMAANRPVRMPPRSVIENRLAEWRGPQRKSAQTDARCLTECWAGGFPDLGALKDAYERRRREIDLIFQDLDDRAAMARRQEWIATLEAYGTSQREMTELRRELMKLARTKGKTDAQAELWADAELRRLAALFEEDKPDGQR